MPALVKIATQRDVWKCQVEPKWLQNRGTFLNNATNLIFITTRNNILIVYSCIYGFNQAPSSRWAFLIFSLARWPWVRVLRTFAHPV